METETMNLQNYGRFEDWAERVIDGEDPDEAARAVGGTGRPGTDKEDDDGDE